MYLTHVNIGIVSFCEQFLPKHHWDIFSIYLNFLNIYRLSWLTFRSKKKFGLIMNMLTRCMQCVLIDNTIHQLCMIIWVQP